MNPDSFFSANIALRHSTRPPFDSYFHALQEKWVMEPFTETFRTVQGSQTSRASKSHNLRIFLSFLQFCKLSFISYYFVCTLFALHNNQKNISDDHKGLRTGNLRHGAFTWRHFRFIVIGSFYPTFCRSAHIVCTPQFKKQFYIRNDIHIKATNGVYLPV